MTADRGADLSIGQLWRLGRDRLAAAGRDNGALDARLLAQHALGLDATALIAREPEPVPAGGAKAFEALIARRLAGEPVARILGHKEFYGLRFGLNAATLVPRPETEMLVDFALSVLEATAPGLVLDLGTGTGCIALAILDKRRGLEVVGVDLSPEAAAQARANAEKLGLADRYTARVGSWYDPVAGLVADLVVSNPPYIESAALPELAVEVARHDPPLALDGGPDGLAPYRIIAEGLGAHLRPGGWVALEIGTGQGDAVAAILTRAGLDAVAIHPDLSGHQRMVTARMPSHHRTKAD